MPPDPNLQDVRFLPAVSPAGLARTPLILVMSYVVLTFILFLTWPIDWPIYTGAAWLGLSAYVVACFGAIIIAMLVGSRGATPVAPPLPGIGPIILIGAVLAAALLIPSSIAYTGRGPWEVLDALQDQAAAYRRHQAQLFFGEGQRTLIAAARMLAGPVVYAALPLGIIHWRRIGWSGRFGVLVVAICSIIFSIMRGTDKEIADLLVIGIAALFVSYGRNLTLAGPGKGVAKRYWLQVILVFLFLMVAQGLFTERKYERLSSFANRNYVCANNSRICADLDAPAIGWLPERQRFGLSVFILSSSSGYFGLNLAREKPFESTYGLGHSPASLAVYEELTGDLELHKRTYTFRNAENQWPEESYWSTLITWIANDVGFAGAIPILGLLGYAWGLWWREAAAGFSDPAAVLFVQATIMIFYLPANNQVFAAYEGYSIFFAWLAIWAVHRSRQLYIALPRHKLAAAQ